MSLRRHAPRRLSLDDINTVTWEVWTMDVIRQHIGLPAGARLTGFEFRWIPTTDCFRAAIVWSRGWNHRALFSTVDLSVDDYHLVSSGVRSFAELLERRVHEACLRLYFLWCYERGPYG